MGKAQFLKKLLETPVSKALTRVQSSVTPSKITKFKNIKLNRGVKIVNSQSVDKDALPLVINRFQIPRSLPKKDYAKFGIPKNQTSPDFKKSYGVANASNIKKANKENLKINQKLDSYKPTTIRGSKGPSSKDINKVYNNLIKKFGKRSSPELGKDILKYLKNSIAREGTTGSGYLVKDNPYLKPEFWGLYKYALKNNYTASKGLKARAKSHDNIKDSFYNLDKIIRKAPEKFKNSKQFKKTIGIGTEEGYLYSPMGKGKVYRKGLSEVYSKNLKKFIPGAGTKAYKDPSRTGPNAFRLLTKDRSKSNSMRELAGGHYQTTAMANSEYAIKRNNFGKVVGEEMFDKKGLKKTFPTTHNRNLFHKDKEIELLNLLRDRDAAINIADKQEIGRQLKVLKKQFEDANVMTVFNDNGKIKYFGSLPESNLKVVQNLEDVGDGLNKFGKTAMKNGGRVGMSIGGIAKDKNKSFGGNPFGTNKVGNIESMLAGIGSGLLDIPKGAFTLGAALMDLGFGTSNAAKVENFFDDLTGLDEKAEATFAGNLTKIMVNLGVPGGFAAKKGAELTKKALLAKKNGNYFKLTDPRLVEKYGTALNTPGRLFSTLGAAGAVGVADMIFVGDPEHVGTIGDMFGGPTQLLENDENSAAREVVNRMKFGLDSSLLVGAVGATGSGLKSLIKRRDELASNNDAIDKFLGAFRPRGMTSQEFFDLNRINIGERAGDINKAGEISRSLDKHIDGIFPFVKNPFNKLGNEGRRDFMAKLNKTLLSGDIDFDAGSKTVRFGEMNKKNVDEIVSMMRDKGGKAEDVQGVLDQFGNIRAKWGDMFTRLGGIMDEDGFAKFSGIFGKKFSDYLGATYEVFKNKSLIPMLNYKPTAEAVEKAVTLFRKTAADKGAPITKEEAEHWVSKVIESANPPASFSTAAERSKGVFFEVPDFFANKSTLADIEGIGLGRTTLAIDELSDAARPVFDDLLGKIDDPMQTILTGTNKLSLVARRNELFQTLKNENATTAIARKEFLDNPDNIGKELPPELRGFFRETEAEAIAGLGRSVKQIIIDPKKTEEAGIINPLHGLYADKGTAEAIEQAAMIAQDKGTLTQLYNSFILYPKATSQMAKTILSPITHARNFISAGAFATANGLIPGLTVSLDDSRAAFKEAYGMLQTNVPGQYSRNTPEANSRYRKLLRLGVVNSGVKMQELQRLLDDVNFGDTVTGTQQLKNMTRQLSKAKKWTEDMYTAEDDFWKISSFAMERGRLKKAYQKYGMDFTDDLLDSEAASLVRNNIPNYDMVSSFVKGLRKLPFGNFVSFPAEIYRTSYNIMAQTIKEFKFQHTLPDGRIVHPFRDIAMKRGMGFGTTVLGVPLATVSAFQAIHNVTEDEMQALRRFVPDWSKNSTLVPIRGDDGKLKYIDFSHANAYDNMIRPWTTMFNGIQKGMDEDELGKNLILSMIEATKETASPFVSESIWTSAIADISPLIGRNGRTQTGRRLWTDETPAGDKFMESIRHLGATVVPGSIPAIVRMKQAVTEEVDEYGRTYEFLDEFLGVAGLRAVQVDPVSAMKFKIADFRTGLNDSRREFTGPLLKGGPITAEQVVDQYQKANQAMFRVQKRMFDDYYAARILGASENQLNNTFQDRVSDLQVRHIKAGRFKPFVPSENIQKAFADNARAIKQPDAFRQASDVIKRIMRQYNNKPLGANELDILDNPFRTSLGTTVTEPFTGLQPLQDLGLTTPTVGNNLNQTAARGQQVFGPTDTIFGS